MCVEQAFFLLNSKIQKLTLFFSKLIMNRMSQLTRTIIKSAKAPGAIGPYSQAVKVGNTIYLSGCLGIDPATGNLINGGIEAEAKQALTNIGLILAEAGASYNNIVKSTVLLADINDFNALNKVYAEFFTSNYPARSTYQVAALPRAARVEIETIAVLDSETPNSQL
jgi:2-iminobutanoate/2-iminopropanoate deaminase